MYTLKLNDSAFKEASADMRNVMLFGNTKRFIYKRNLMFDKYKKELPIIKKNVDAAIIKQKNLIRNVFITRNKCMNVPTAGTLIRTGTAEQSNVFLTNHSHGLFGLGTDMIDGLHLVVWSRNPKTKSIAHAITSKTDSVRKMYADAIRHMKRDSITWLNHGDNKNIILRKAGLSEYVNKTISELEKIGLLQFGFHIIPSIGHLHLHVMFGTLTAYGLSESERIITLDESLDLLT
jgi:hypothetical protein